MSTDHSHPALQSGLVRLFDSSPHLVLVGVDAAHCVVVFNQGAEKLLGYSAREVMGKPVDDLLADPTEMERYTVEMIAVVGGAASTELALFDAYLKKVSSARWEWTYRHKQGHTIVVSEGMEIIRDDRGRALAMLGIATGEQARQREAELIGRATLSHQIFETAHDGILLFDANGFLDCNQRALDMFQIDRATLSLIHPGELSPPLQPDGRNSLEVAKSYAHQAFREGHISFEWVHRRFDGEEFPCEVVLLRFEYDGRNVLQACLRDITDRKRAEMEIIKSRELFAHFMRYFPGYAWLKDDSYRFVYVNRKFAEGFGIDSQEWMGKTAGELLSPDFALSTEDFDRQAMERRETINVVEEADHVDGSRHYYLSYKFPVVMPDNSCMLGGISMDITSIKLMEQQLAEAKRSAEDAAKAKSIFLANMSHEIRTPLNGILCMLDILADSKLNPEQDDGLRIVRDSADALLGIVNDVLDFSKIESGKLELESIDFDLAALIGNVVDTFSGRAQQKALKIKAVFAPGTIMALRGDGMRLRQVLLNLLSNAIKFTDTGGVIISARTESREARLWLDISVRDSGIGIAAEAMSRLFQSFSQLESSTTRRYGGTGLGLVICRQLTELMGGSIGVDSRAGKGSTFWVRIPLQPAVHQEITLPPITGLPPSIGRKGLRILVVDDNRINQTVARKALEKLGHSVALASNGEEALRSWHAYRFDIVFMDCQMPVMDGYEAVQRIRDAEQAESRARQVIVAMTASALPEEKARCISCGMDDFLAKPVKLAALAQLIERWATAREEPLATP